MEIIKSFGFQPTFFAAQIVNFLILAFVFKKFLYKPVLKVLSDRKKQVAQGIEDAQAARVALEHANEEKDKLIKAATLEAEKIIEETKKSTDLMRSEALAAAKNEADRIISEGKENAALEMERSKGQAKEMALDLSRELLNKVLSEIFNKEEKEKILARNINRLKEYE